MKSTLMQLFEKKEYLIRPIHVAMSFFKLVNKEARDIKNFRLFCN